MRIFGYYHYAFGVCIAVAMLAGCEGSQPPTGTPMAMQQRVAQKGALETHSWIAPQATKSDLLYVSDNLGNQVYVFSYPSGNVVGKLTGFGSPIGECVDKAGNVWIVNSSPAEIVEYAHGGTSPIAILNDAGGSPFGCAVDQTTGNLAVTNGNNVAVYQNAEGMPTTYSDPYLTGFFYCTYDNQGNLFADGGSSTLIAELPKGGSALTNITLSKTIASMSIQRYGGYLAIRDNGGGSHGPTTIDHVQVSGSTGTVVGSSLLIGRGDRKVTTGVQYWIQGDAIVGPGHSLGGNSRILEFWHYPAGGTATKVVRPPGAIALWGTTVSLAKK